MKKSILIFDCMNDGEFLGEFANENSIPEDLFDGRGPIFVRREGDKAICSEHPMMSPLPDLVIENADELSHGEIWERTSTWWHENYG